MPWFFSFSLKAVCAEVWLAGSEFTPIIASGKNPDHVSK